jgi:hypothetical protein
MPRRGVLLQGGHLGRRIRLAAKIAALQGALSREDAGGAASLPAWGLPCAFLKEAVFRGRICPNDQNIISCVD